MHISLARPPSSITCHSRTPNPPRCLARPPTPAVSAEEEGVDIVTVVAPKAEDGAAAPAPESPESPRSEEEDWVKVDEAAPESVDTVIEPATVVPDTDTVVEVSVPVDLAEASADGECDEKVLCRVV